jgi:hypothetical protein
MAFFYAKVGDYWVESVTWIKQMQRTSAAVINISTASYL